MSWLITFARAYSSSVERRSRIQNEKKTSPKWDSNRVPSACEAKEPTIALLDLIYIEYLKVDPVLPKCAIKNYLYHVFEVVKCFVAYNIVLTTYS